MAIGVYTSFKKDGTEYYRVSVTYKRKHISLGSFADMASAQAVYNEATQILWDIDAVATHFINTDKQVTSFDVCSSDIAFDKYITLINFRDSGMYIKTPIYLCDRYFLYFMSEHVVFTFDIEDLFYYSTHRIIARGGHLYVNDFGMQSSILSRYGIKPHSVAGRDYIFRNSNEHDYRYENIQIINRYFGVQRITHRGRTMFKTRIHVIGDHVIGLYSTEAEAAIAYNRAADMLEPLTHTHYDRNFIEDITKIEYASYYNMVRIRKDFREYVSSLSVKYSDI